MDSLIGWRVWDLIGVHGEMGRTYYGTYGAGRLLFLYRTE